LNNRFWPLIKTIVGSITVMMCLVWAGSAQAGEPFKLQLRWYDQAQFMGYYMALNKGYYEAEGLT